MDLEIRWMQPFALRRADANSDFWYEFDELDELPDGPGVYFFSRVHGESVCPLYIGRAEDLRRRIEQQLNNLRLMKALERQARGQRMLHVAEFVAKGGQSVEKALAVIESALISTAMVEGFELVNKQGTKTLAHTISSTGNRTSRSWLPENEIRVRRA